MKPGDLERNLTRLVEVAREAQSRLATAGGEVVALRHVLELPLPVDGALEPRAGVASEAVSMEAAFK